MEYGQSYCLQIERIMCLVLMPRGQTMMHLPHNMHFESIGLTSCPRCSARITLRMLIPLNGAAVHVAEHEPQAIQVFTSGSVLHRRSYTEVSILSRSMVELLLSLKPKSAILQVVMNLNCNSAGLSQRFRNRLCTGTSTGIEDAFAV